MKLFVLVMLLLVIVIFLNRSYAHIYNFIDSKNLRTPYSQTTYSFAADDQIPKVKYVALGDSLTAGVGVEDFHQTYAFAVAQNFSNSGKQIALINLAVPGYRTEELIKYELPRAIKENPDYISLLIGINDLHGLKSPSEFELNFNQIIHTLLKKTHAKILVLNLPFLGSDKLIGFPYNILLDYQTKKFNSIISKSCQGYKNVTCIDLYGYYQLKSKPNSFVYSADLFHPSGIEYAKWAELLYPFFK